MNQIYDQQFNADITENRNFNRGSPVYLEARLKEDATKAVIFENSFYIPNNVRKEIGVTGNNVFQKIMESEYTGRKWGDEFFESSEAMDVADKVLSQVETEYK